MVNTYKKKAAQQHSSHTHKSKTTPSEQEPSGFIKVRAHPGQGCDPRACSSASLPAAGALCTEVVGHETPHG